MIIYKDIFTDDEIATDSHPSQLIADGSIMAVQSRMVTVGDETFDTGANASEEAAADEAVEQKVEKVINLVQAHGLQVYQCTKGEFGTLIKAYFKALEAKLAAVSAEKLAAFKKHQPAIQKWFKDELLPKFDDYAMYVCSKAVDLNAPTFMIIPARWGDSAAPTFYYLVDGLLEEKV